MISWLWTAQKRIFRFGNDAFSRVDDLEFTGSRNGFRECDNSLNLRYVDFKSAISGVLIDDLSLLRSSHLVH